MVNAMKKKLGPGDIEVTEDFQAALDLMEQGESVFITGKAGTGKTTLIDLFRRETKKNAAALAPTGVAALNIRGQTIHSFFQLPPRLIKKDEDVKKFSN
jgi:ABC-type ATPase involved in cell division